MNKKAVNVTIVTKRFKVNAVAYIEEGFRLTDFLNTAEVQFLPLTNVTVSELGGKEIDRAKFVCINKNSIVFARSEDEDEK